MINLSQWADKILEKAKESVIKNLINSKKYCTDGEKIQTKALITLNHHARLNNNMLNVATWK